MPDLEEQLASLASSIEWPATPRLNMKPLLLSVRGEMAGAARGRGSSPRPVAGRWALAAAAVLVIVATLVAYAPTREAIAGWLNLHTNIQRTEHPPTPSPLPSGPLGSSLGLGTQVTLAAAHQQVSWTIQLPSTLVPPDELLVNLPPT